MIRQYLPQTNESATVAKSKKFSHLNKALLSYKTNKVTGENKRESGHRVAYVNSIFLPMFVTMAFTS